MRFASDCVDAGMLFTDVPGGCSTTGLFLTVYANQAPNFKPPNIERRVIYDLKTHKVALEK
jgi:hypothetical protein